MNAAIGARGGYLVEAALLIVGLVGLGAIRFRGVPPRADGDSLWRSLAEGLRYFRSQQVLLAAVTLDLLSVLFGGAVALLPIFVVDILHSGPSGLGLLRAAPAVGAVVMSIYLAWRPPFRRAGRALLVAVTIFGLATIGFGLARAIWLSFACLVVTGAADMISVVVRSTLLQLLVPDRLMGRVSAVNSIFIGSSNEIGGFESGVTARLLGAVPAVLLGGVLTLATVGGTAWLAPDLRRVGRLDELGKELKPSEVRRRRTLRRSKSTSTRSVVMTTALTAHHGQNERSRTNSSYLSLSVKRKPSPIMNVSRLVIRGSSIRSARVPTSDVITIAMYPRVPISATSTPRNQPYRENCTRSQLCPDVQTSWPTRPSFHRWR